MTNEMRITGHLTMSVNLPLGAFIPFNFLSFSLLSYKPPQLNTPKAVITASFPFHQEDAFSASLLVLL
jgi:hypothetical protein